VRGLGRIDGFSKRVVLDALLEDPNTIMVAADLVVRVVLRLRYVIVGIDVDVGLRDSSSKGDFASCQSIFAELLGFDLLDDSPCVVGLPLGVAKDLRGVACLRLQIRNGGLL
jgi:hypothetical protein